MKPSFTFRAEWLQAANSLNDPRLAAELLNAITQYGVYGVRPQAPSVEVAALMIVIVPQIDAANARKQSCKQPGKKRKAHPSSNPLDVDPAARPPRLQCDEYGHIVENDENVRRVNEYFRQLPDSLTLDVISPEDHHKLVINQLTECYNRSGGGDSPEVEKRYGNTFRQFANSCLKHSNIRVRSPIFVNAKGGRCLDVFVHESKEQCCGIVTERRGQRRQPAAEAVVFSPRIAKNYDKIALRRIPEGASQKQSQSCVAPYVDATHICDIIGERYHAMQRCAPQPTARLSA